MSDGHDHWSWTCRRDIGGCGYATPFYSPTQESAQDKLHDHWSTCRSQLGEDYRKRCRSGDQ